MYNGISSGLETSTNDVNQTKTEISNLGLEEIWQGSASEALNDSLNQNVNALGTAEASLKIYNKALKRVDECIAIDKEIDSLEAQIAAINETSASAESRIAAIRAQISALIEKKNQIKDQIKAMLASISEIYGASLTIEFSDWEDLTRKVDLYKKLPVTNSRKGVGSLFEELTIVDENGNVIRDGEEYFNNTIKRVRELYSGSEQNYYTSLAIIDLCLEAGVRPEYKHKGTGAVKSDVTQSGWDRVPVASSVVSSGIDCNAFVSYILFGDDSETSWLSTKQFNSAGTGVNLEDAQSGDIFTGNGHVGMIMDYNQETGEYVIYHASGSVRDSVLEVVSANYFKTKGYDIRRVDDEYTASNHSAYNA